MLQLDALASPDKDKLPSAPVIHTPLSQTPQLEFKPVFESGSTGADSGYVHMGGKVVVVKVCRELCVTSWNLLSFRHILCTFDPSLNVKVAPPKVLV